MAYITTDNLTVIMAEMTDYCNAACPLCQRYDWNLNLSETVNKNHTTLQFVKERIGNNIIAQLDKWMCQGTYGDATMNPETVEIFSYLREVNPNIKIEMWSNGGARDAQFWQRMAELKVNVIFGIDGLEDTNHLYRRNVKWAHLIRNVKSFIDNGGKATWSFLIFKHNQHQVQTAKQLSKEIGFTHFESNFSERWQDFNSAGEYRDIETITVDDYKLEKPEQPKDFIKHTGDVVLSKNTMNQEKDDFLSKKIQCDSCLPKKKQIYLRANGYVSPCCFLGDVEVNEPKNIINDYKQINLNYTSLQEILDGEFFFDLYQGINGSEKRLRGCYNMCGVD